MAILYAVIVHYLFWILDSIDGAIDELCDVNLDIPTNCTVCIKCCNATEGENISIPTYCSKCPRCNEGKYYWIVVNIFLLKISGCTILPIVFFFFHNWIAPTFSITDSPVRDCSDVGNLPLGNEAECREAALSFGISFGYELSLSNNPKGCYISYGKNVYWNNHESGSERSNRFPICKPDGKYCLRYGIHIYQTSII